MIKLSGMLNLQMRILMWVLSQLMLILNVYMSAPYTLHMSFLVPRQPDLCIFLRLSVCSLCQLLQSAQCGPGSFSYDSSCLIFFPSEKKWLVLMPSFGRAKRNVLVIGIVFIYGQTGASKNFNCSGFFPPYKVLNYKAVGQGGVCHHNWCVKEAWCQLSIMT